MTGVTLASSLPKTPEWKFTLSPVYTIDLDGHGTVLLSADYTRTSSLYNDPENTSLLRRPATDVLNASITYKAPSDHWEPVGGVTNLTNDRYLTTGQNQVAGGVAYGTYNRPMEWFVTARPKYLALDINPVTLGALPPEELGKALPIIMEEFGWGDGGLSVTIGACQLPPLLALMFGKEYLLQRYPVDLIGCWAITEPDHGSDSLDPSKQIFHPQGNYGRPNCCDATKFQTVAITY